MSMQNYCMLFFNIAVWLQWQPLCTCISSGDSANVCDRLLYHSFCRPGFMLFWRSMLPWQQRLQWQECSFPNTVFVLSWHRHTWEFLVFSVHLDSARGSVPSMLSKLKNLYTNPAIQTTIDLLLTFLGIHVSKAHSFCAYTYSFTVTTWDLNGMIIKGNWNNRCSYL